MDMGMGMDMDPAVANLPLSDPRCIDAAEMCTAFYAGENASQAAIPFATQFEYGHWTTYYWVIILGLFFLFHLLRRWTPSFDKVKAAGRSVFYRPVPRLGILDLPRNVGLLSLIIVTIVFLTGLTFAQRPYYREYMGFGSPPIAIRTGLMAFACIPILVALAGKVNIVTVLTGISHERLNVLHRWVAWISLALSLVHAIPFLIQSGREGKLKEDFYAYGMIGCNEYSGVPPFGMLVGLCFLSLPGIRQRFYESFYLVHILLAISYVGLLFWHAADTLDSWAYLWATIAVWLASFFARMFWKTQAFNIKKEWFSGSPVMLTPLGDVTRIQVVSDVKISPGQHVFLRFAFAPLHNHPFTVASTGDGLLFLAKKYSGFTEKLATYASSSRNTHVWIDGPYGGHNLDRFDSIILLAGGTGITACLPWLKSNKRVILIWAVRGVGALEWVRDELEEAKDKQIRIHVTGSDEKIVEGEKVAFTAGRPVMTDALEEFVKPGERTAVVGCGPEGFHKDLANAVAAAQKRVLRGEISELAMYIENFNW